MFKKLFIGVTSAYFMLMSGASADSCLTLNTTSIGNPSGTNYTDYDYLTKNEDPSFYYRLAVLQLCTNSANTLTGMRAVVAMIIASTNTVATQIPLNRYGSVTETNISCSNFTLNFTTSEFLSNMTVFYTSKVVTRIVLTSNKG